MAHQIHTLLLVALLVPFAGITAAMLYVVFYRICWKGSK